MKSKKRKSAKKPNGFRVSFSMLLHTGKWKKDVTAIVYKTRLEAQNYADQLNRSHRFKNARVRKA